VFAPCSPLFGRLSDTVSYELFALSDVVPTASISVEKCRIKRDRSIIGPQRARKEQAARIPGSCRLLQQPCQIGSVLRIEEVATPGEEATDTYRILGHLVATHATIAFFNPPANGTLAGIVGAIERFSLGSFLLAIARQAMPEIPPIQK
jgi:hypothetical protein